VTILVSEARAFSDEQSDEECLSATSVLTPRNIKLALESESLTPLIRRSSGAGLALGCRRWDARKRETFS
jgi:hypothetical protein